MTGPSLRKKCTHHSIHDGIYTEARDLTQLLKQLADKKENNHIGEIADALIEHWEKRTLAHADSEEEGLFVEKLQNEPELEEIIGKLKRDHELLHLILERIKDSFASNGVTENVLRDFDALLVLFEIHNQEEEAQLFTEN